MKDDNCSLGQSLVQLDDVRRSGLKGFFLRLLGCKEWGIKHIEDGVRVLGAQQEVVPFSNLSEPLKASQKFGFSAIVVKTRSGATKAVAGLSARSVAEFVEAANGRFL